MERFHESKTPPLQLTFKKGRRDARVPHLTKQYPEELQTQYTHFAHNHKTPRTTPVVPTPKVNIAAVASYLQLSVGASEATAIAHVTAAYRT